MTGQPDAQASSMTLGIPSQTDVIIRHTADFMWEITTSHGTTSSTPKALYLRPSILTTSTKRR
jgi:hypothetical protein